MYLSHPVRRIRERPDPVDSVSLVVELDGETTAETLVSVADELEGSVDRDLGFSAHLVTIPETAVDDLCDVAGIERIETADTISFTPDHQANETEE